LISSTILSNDSLINNFYNFSAVTYPASPVTTRSSLSRESLDPSAVTIKDIIFAGLLSCPVDGVRTYFMTCFEKLCTGVPDSVEATHPIAYFAEMLVSKFPWPEEAPHSDLAPFYSSQYFTFLGKLIIMDKDKVILLGKGS
jgi:hypothetical protein